ncbi:hypothetical protein HID58_061982 [Brassica napus]|uniref:Defensin-like protein n=1 Tax=Brassica napus TaxID=3708 RepID=A0ABQ8A040_BRANA|nr:hypothetical protein HID58_061982 [Brassica napus]
MMNIKKLSHVYGTLFLMISTIFFLFISRQVSSSSDDENDLCNFVNACSGCKAFCKAKNSYVRECVDGGPDLQICCCTKKPPRVDGVVIP